MRSILSFFLRRTHTQNVILNKTARVPVRSAPPNWRGLYVAALLETDKGRKAQRIADAQMALVVRARELFHATSDNLEEESAIDDALFALHALEQCTGAGARQYAQRRA